MGTYTITINERTKVGRSFLELAKGLTEVKIEDKAEATTKPLNADKHFKEEKKAFLYHSRISAAQNFSKYL